MTTIAEAAYMAKIGAMRCVACRLLDMEQDGRSYVHHIREDREARNDWLTIPLCWSHHQGRYGIHGTKDFLRLLKMSEWGLLAATIKQLMTEDA